MTTETEHVGGGCPDVLLFADFRNPHALGWRDGLLDSSVPVHCASSEPCEGFDYSPDLVGWARGKVVASGYNNRIRQMLSSIGRNEGSLTAAHCSSSISKSQILESLATLTRYRKRRKFLETVAGSPGSTIIHALRIPYEGVSLCAWRRGDPLVVSSWGQDFAVQANRDPLLARRVRELMPRLSGFAYDNVEDLEWAYRYGLSVRVPTLQIAGNFGVDETLFFPTASLERQPSVTVLYPRGLRDYVDHRLFLRLAKDPVFSDCRFVGVGLAGDPFAEESRDQNDQLSLTPNLGRAEFAELMRGCDVVVSPAISDGTPNSILEALACGAHVLAGDIPPLRALSAELDSESLVLLSLDQYERWRDALIDTVARIRDRRPNSDSRPLLPDPYKRGANRVRVREFYARVLHYGDGLA